MQSGKQKMRENEWIGGELTAEAEQGKGDEQQAQIFVGDEGRKRKNNQMLAFSLCRR